MKEIIQKEIFSEKLSSSVKKLMDLHNVNMHQLHRATRTPLTTINRIINEKSANPTITSLLPLSDFFGVTLNQLMGIDPLDTDSMIGKYANKRSHWTAVPIISWEDASEWPKPINQSSKNTISTDITIGKDTFALVITETNWEGFFPNTTIIIDPTISLEHGDYAITLKNGQKRASLKQILIDDDRIYLRPVNKEYQTQIMDESYKCLGVVMQIRMDRK